LKSKRKENGGGRSERIGLGSGYSPRGERGNALLKTGEIRRRERLGTSGVPGSDQRGFVQSTPRVSADVSRRRRNPSGKKEKPKKKS